MKTPKRILVVISGKHTEHSALERALKFTEYDDVHIHLFNAIYEPVMEVSDVLSSEHRKEMKSQYMGDRYLYMDSIADTLDKKGISCSVNVAWHRDLHEAIEEVVDELKPDLVIKRISAKTTNLNPFTMPVDRHLLRYCNAPLLLIKSSKWARSPVLAAIDPTASDENHIALNHTILEYGKMLTHCIETKLHCVNTYQTPNIGSVMDMGAVNVDYHSISADICKANTSKMQRLLSEHDLTDNPWQVLEGDADIAIPQMAEEIDTQLVILGTVGRTGLSAAFIGNTAERILANLNCEILALQPDMQFIKEHV
jgi:universal stress protein E